MGDDTYGYAYDPIGNRIVTTYLPSVVHPTHDADGNMAFLPSTSGGGAGGEGWYFQWNGENRLILASNAQHIVTYAYDHRGRMVRKDASVWDEQLAAYSPQLTAEFLWDGWNLVGETVAVGSGSTQSVATNYYTWGLDLSGTLQGAGGIGGLLATVLGGAFYTAVYDANGNVTEYIDDSGAIAAHYEYSPFGNAVVQSGEMAQFFTHRFSTKCFDNNTGLGYWGYRYYHTDMGRWLSRDPIGELGGLAMYVAMGNNAVIRLDFRGLDAELYYKLDIRKRKLKKVWSKCDCQFDYCTGKCVSADWKPFDTPEYIWTTIEETDRTKLKKTKKWRNYVWEIIDALSLVYGTTFVNPDAVSDFLDTAVEFPSRSGNYWYYNSATRKFELQLKSYLGDCTCDKCGDVDYITEDTGEEKTLLGEWIRLSSE